MNPYKTHRSYPIYLTEGHTFGIPNNEGKVTSSNSKNFVHASCFFGDAYSASFSDAVEMMEDLIDRSLGWPLF